MPGRFGSLTIRRMDGRCHCCFDIPPIPKQQTDEVEKKAVFWLRSNDGRIHNNNKSSSYMIRQILFLSFPTLQDIYCWLHQSQESYGARRRRVLVAFILRVYGMLLI